MGNCKSDLTFGHVIVDISDQGDIHEAIKDMLSTDLDLENVGELVNTIMKGKTISTRDEFEVIFSEAFDILNNQEFFGNCSYSIIKLDMCSAVSLTWIVGGNY